MNITNKHDLPEVLVKFARAKNYNRGDAKLSVTQLINSPRIVALQERHHDEMEQDISDVLFSLLGTATHYVLEQYSEEEVLTEQRYFHTINGWKISGAIDRQVKVNGGRVLEDWKVTSAYACVLYIRIGIQLNTFSYPFSPVLPICSN